MLKEPDAFFLRQAVVSETTVAERSVMKFFDREDKIARLREIRERSRNEAQFTVVTGRRRIGKTELVKRALGDRDFVYLFVSRKSEADLVSDFVEEFNRVVPDSVSPEIRTLQGFFREVFKVAQRQPVTVFIDEFQDFYRFWFRFVFKHDGLVQMKAFEMLRKFVRRDYPVFSGLALESLLRKKLSESGEWSRIGNWWDRKGENEIDLIAQNELEDVCLVAEVKRDRRRLDLTLLREKFDRCRSALGLAKSVKVEFKGLSPEDLV